MVVESIVGDTLVRNDGTEILTSELSTAKGGVIGIYFSAHWCPPCRGFTPKLAEVYNELKEAKKDFEIVFVSWDSDDNSFKEYHKSMPWLAIPFDKSDVKDPLTEKFEVNGIPSLILLEADTGEVITKEGRNPVSEYGAQAFPFTKERIEEVKKEATAKKEESLKSLADLKFLGALTTPDGQEVSIEDLRSSEALAFAFMKGENCQGSAAVLPKLLDIQKSLGKEKLGVVVIEMQEDEGDEVAEDVKEKLKGVPVIPRGDRAKEVVNSFKCVESDIDTPHVFVVDAKDPTFMKILAENAARNIYFRGEAAYPWSEEAIKALEEREAKLKEEMKSKIVDLQCFAASDSCHVVDKSGAAVELSCLQSKDVVGVYFSAHWCGPCRSFTPKLIELYNECKEKGKSFEVVFVSSDQDKDAFNSYYGDMPWCALSYDDRSLKDALSDVFDVEGIPTLVLLNGKGEKITDDGRAAVSMGIDYFPWDEESMKRGREEEEEREKKRAEAAKAAEEAGYAEQEAAGKIVLRRHKGGASDIKITAADHTVAFDSFSTVAAPDAIVSEGQKAFYEVVFKKGDGLSQMGWATSDFTVCDSHSGDGVGDDACSWGFDGQRQCKWFDGSTAWGEEFTPNGDNVLGIAADMVEGKIHFGLNGNWSEPMGVAFSDLDKGLKLFPALTGSSMTVEVNFGDTEMKFGPPDDSFTALHKLLKSS